MNDTTLVVMMLIAGVIAAATIFTILKVYAWILRVPPQRRFWVYFCAFWSGIIFPFVLLFLGGAVIPEWFHRTDGFFSWKAMGLAALVDVLVTIIGIRLAVLLYRSRATDDGPPTKNPVAEFSRMRGAAARAARKSRVIQQERCQSDEDSPELRIESMDDWLRNTRRNI